MYSARLFGTAEPEEGPGDEQQDQGGPDAERECCTRRFPHDLYPRGRPRIKVMGLTADMAEIQPASSPWGTKTGARKRTKKMGVRMSGPACWVRESIATPAPKRVAATLTSRANPTSPKRSTPPLTRIPASSAMTVTTVPVTVARTREAAT